jgi:hypothetical protein
MSQYEPTIPVRYTAPLLEALRQHRPPWLAGVLAEAGLDPAMLHHCDATLTMARFDALLRAIAKHTGRDDLGFELGLRITPQHHGALAGALQRCTTLDDLLRLLARYFRLITPSFFLHYRRRADGGEFIWRPAAAMSPWTLRAIEEVSPCPSTCKSARRSSTDSGDTTSICRCQRPPWRATVSCGPHGSTSVTCLCPRSAWSWTARSTRR